MEKYRLWIAPISQTVAVLVAVGGLVWWGAVLQTRVATLESQMYAVLLAPKVVSIPQQQPSSSQAVSPSNVQSTGASESGVTYTEEQYQYLTPLGVACVNLAGDMTMALAQHTKKGDQAGAAIKNLMSDLQCSMKNNN
jgi:hypothetical protein